MKRSLRNGNVSGRDDLLNIFAVAEEYVSYVTELEAETDIERTTPSILKGVKSVRYTSKNKKVSFTHSNHHHPNTDLNIPSKISVSIYHCVDQLLQIRNLKNRFNITATRVTNCGANVYLGVFPKDEIERTDSVEFDSPKNSAVSDLSKGYLLTVDKPNFTRWHSDYMEAVDCLITLYGSGEKHWFFVPPSKMCGVLERCYTRKK